MSDTRPPSRTRTDIQALRGFAVLMVVFYHAKIGAIQGGYLGVDVFFVISGFLITRMVRDSLDSGAFSFSEFYFRRAMRLLPAAYVTFLVTALLAPFFLATVELEDFKGQVAGAVTFLSNIVLWRQSGYFSGEAELKPLLHIWSLSIEEQYYFLLPAVMFLAPRRFWKSIAISMVLISLVLCLYYVARKSSATFYLLPTRAWELGLGSVGALVTIGVGHRRFLQAAFWPALVVLLGALFFPMGPYHPGPDAVLVCSATLIIILREHPLFDSLKAMRVPSRVGDISYSLYLVHWPLFAFLNNAWFGSPDGAPLSWRMGLILLSLVLAILLNRFVEEPFRRLRIVKSRKVVVRTVGLTTLLVALSVGIAQANMSDTDFAHSRRANQGLGAECDFEGPFRPTRTCSTSDAPNLLMWGDSFMMHLVPGVVALAGPTTEIAQATMSACGPLKGMSIVRPAQGYGPAWAMQCMAFNDSVLAYLSEAESIDTVVISSAFGAYMGDHSAHKLSVRSAAGDLRLVSPDIEVALASLRQTVDEVRRLGKRVVVVSPPPSAGFDTARCLERRSMGLPALALTANFSCQISQPTYRSSNAKVLEFLARIPAEANVEVVSFDAVLCRSRMCDTSIEGVALYRDRAHLSYEGSVALAKRSGLLDEILVKAR